MKTAKTFLVGSLFEYNKYIAVCSDSTGEIIKHIDKDQPPPPASYDIFSFKEGAGMQLLDNKPTQRSAGECKETWFMRLRHSGYRIIISPRFDEPTVSNDNGNQEQELNKENENQLILNF